MAKKSTKKVDTKKQVKTHLYDELLEFLTSKGYEVVNGADNYEKMSAHTLVVKNYENMHDVQVSLVTPKAGEDTYDYRAYEEEDE